MKLAALFSLVGALCCAACLADDALRFSHVEEKNSRVEVRGWSEAELARLKQADLASEGSRNLLEVFVAGETSQDAAAVPVFGRLQFADGALAFAPRYPFLPGVAYRAVVRRQLLSDEAASDTTPGQAYAFKIPEIVREPSTVVSQVYPTADVLPENQLKLYLHFSAPMSRGRVYRHMHLLRADGSEVEFPFLELDEELWDSSGRRLTVFFDPGRIKRGLKPREDVGPVLEEGNTYTLVIDAGWEDANGRPLVRPFRKVFKSAPPDDAQPDHKQWKVALPQAGTRQALLVVFNEPLDHAMLQRVLAVRPVGGEFVEGQVEVDRGETRWRFTPDSAWNPGPHEIVVSAALEDRAGNSIRRPFEVDLFEKVDGVIETPTVSVPFETAPAR